MPPLTGQRTSLNITQAIRAIDMRAEILELEPDAAPLCQLTMGKQAKIGTEATHNPKFDWVEDTLMARFDAINNGAGYTNVATVLVVDDATKFNAWDLLKVTRTGEVMRVVSQDSAVQITVERGIGAAAAALLDNDELLKIASADAEGADVRSGVTGNPAVVSNYTQIFRNSWEATETLVHSNTFTRPSDWRRQGAKTGIEHKKSQELAFWLGRPRETTLSGKPHRTTGGILHFVTSNVTNVGGAMSETAFYNGFRTAFRYGNKKAKTLFCSRLFADVINTYPRGKIQQIQSDQSDTHGLAVSRFVSPQGTLNVIITDLFEGLEYAGYGVVVDLSSVRRRPLANEEGSRDTQILPNRQGRGIDGRQHEYLTEVGLEVGLEKTHAIYKGVTG